MRTLALAILLAAPAASADPSNFRPYLVGARAGGMGGAFTALADDPSGPIYNPAGIAHVTRSQFSLSGSLFGVVSGSIKDALGDGNNFGYASLQTFPIQTSAVYKFGPDPATSPDALGLSIFVPNSTSVDDRAALAAGEFFFVAKDDSVWAGPTYARRFGRVSVGISLFGLLNTSVQQLDMTGAPSTDTFANVSGRFDELSLGIVAGLGVRWDATDNLVLGASIYSPEWTFYSQRKAYVRFALATPEQNTIATVDAENLRAGSVLPLRAQAGIAWQRGDLTLAADVIFLAPRRVRDNEDRASEGLNRVAKRDAVVNGSVGMELLLTPSIPFRLGAWTDLSAAPDPTPEEEADNATRLNRFGGSIGIGIRSEHTESNISVNVAYASGTTIIPDNLDFSVLRTTDQTEVGAYLVFATSFQF